MSNIIEIGGGASGGSNVVANPVEAATDTLSKIGIDGTIYEVSGGGGSGYSETTLWSGSETPTTSGTQITLSDNISNYDEIVFVLDTDYVGTGSFLVSELTIGESYISTIYAPNNYGVFFVYDSDTQITIKSLSSGSLKTYIKVIGIKYGSGGTSGYNYSTTEQVVGTWIDGSTIFERSYAITNQNISTGWTVLVSSISIDKFISGEVCISSGGYDYTWNALYYNNGNIAVYNFLGGAIQSANGYVTIRYTKSS